MTHLGLWTMVALALDRTVVDDVTELRAIPLTSWPTNSAGVRFYAVEGDVRHVVATFRQPREAA